MLDALYLTWYKIGGTAALCEGLGDCSTVNNSRFAEIGGVPIALLGAGAYLLLLAVHAAEWRGDLASENAVLIAFGLGLVGTLYSAYLTYIEIFVLKAICPFCVVSALLITVIFVASVLRLVDGENQESQERIQEG